MIIDFLLELKNNINEHGIRWGVFFTLVALYRKEKRNLKLDDRDEALFHNQKIMMDQMGVGDKWRGPPKKSKLEDLSSLKKSFASLRPVITRAIKSRRTKHMNPSINWYTLIASLVGAAKLILQPFGLEIPDQQYNELANGAAALITIIGVFMSHRKGGTVNVPSQPTVTIDNNK